MYVIPKQNVTCMTFLDEMCTVAMLCKAANEVQNVTLKIAQMTFDRS